jgi:hypothetical protein
MHPPVGETQWGKPNLRPIERLIPHAILVSVAACGGASSPPIDEPVREATTATPVPTFVEVGLVAMGGPGVQGREPRPLGCPLRSVAAEIGPSPDGVFFDGVCGAEFVPARRLDAAGPVGRLTVCTPDT